MVSFLVQRYPLSLHCLFFCVVTIVILVLLGVVRWYIQKKRIFEKSKFVKINEILGKVNLYHMTIM